MSAIIALIAFTKCSPFSRINCLVPTISVSHFKMSDDGTILCLANYVYNYSLHAWTMIFFLLVFSHSPFELYPGTSNPKSAPMVAVYSGCREITAANWWWWWWWWRWWWLCCHSLSLAHISLASCSWRCSAFSLSTFEHTEDKTDLHLSSTSEYHHRL